MSYEKWRCLACQYPTCEGCKKTNGFNEGPAPPPWDMKRGEPYRCSACARVPCAQCKEAKALKDFDADVQHYRQEGWRCLACQYPRCTASTQSVPPQLAQGSAQGCAQGFVNATSSLADPTALWPPLADPSAKAASRTRF